MKDLKDNRDLRIMQMWDPPDRLVKIIVLPVILSLLTLSKIIDKFSKITHWLKLKIKQHHSKVLSSTAFH